MEDRYSFAESLQGLQSLIFTTLHLRRAGQRTRVVERRVAGFALYTIIATPAERPNRKERGCYVRS